MDLYGLKACDTCRKAVRDLEEAGRTVRVIDIRKDGVSREDLQRFHDSLGDALVNRKSKTWRELSHAERDGDAVALIDANPTLMKRPVIDDDGTLYLGWGEDVRAALAG